MRDGLTTLAGLLVFALLAALVVPGFMNWNAWRPAIDAALGRSLRLDLVSSGDVALRLLPTPRLALAGIEAGQPGQSRLSIGRLDLEISATALLRGEIRIISARADNVTGIIELDADGKLILPGGNADGANGANGPTAIDRLDITRGRIILNRNGRSMLELAPVAAEISASDLRGPWRLTGEVAGTPVRIATGMADEAGLRTKVSIGSAPARLELDGVASLNANQPGFTGTLALLGTAKAEPAQAASPVVSPALSATARITLAGQVINLAAIAIDLPGQPGRIDGDAVFGLLPGTPRHIDLTTKRLDLAAMGEIDSALLRQLGTITGGTPISFTATAEQLVLSGEDITQAQAKGSIHSGIPGTTQDALLRIDTASAQFAGSELAAAGTLATSTRTGTLQLTLLAPDTRRLAITLARMGLDPVAADYVSALGRTRADAALEFNPMGWQLNRINGESGDARWSGSITATPQRIDIAAAGRNLSLAGLPNLARLGSGRAIGISIDIDQARLPGIAPGQIAARIEHDGQGLAIRKLVASGFGGVQVEASGSVTASDSGLRGTIVAPDAAPVLALLQPFIPERTARALGRKLRLLSPLDLNIAVAPSGTGGNINLAGRLGAGHIKGSAVLAQNMGLASGALTYEADSTATLAAILGLPTAANPQGRAVVTTTLNGSELALQIVAGALSLTGNGQFSLQDGKGDILITARAPSAAVLVPGAWVPALPQGPLAFTALLRLSEERTSLERITGSTMPDMELGSLALEGDGSITGTLTLPRLDAAALLAAAAGGPVFDGTASNPWSAKPFADTANPLIGRVTFSVRQVALGNLTTGPAAFTMVATPDETRLGDLSLQAAGGTATGDIRLSRSGTLASLAARLELAGLNLASMSNGALTGTLTGRLTAGGAGETAGRLMNGFAGSGEIAITALAIDAVAPNALPQVATATSEDGLSQPALRQQLDAAFRANPWPIGNIRAPLSITGGVARIALADHTIGTAQISPRLAIDLRQLQLDARAPVRVTQRPQGWVGDMPQAQVTWSGPLLTPERRIETGILANALAQRTLQREVERIDAFEADARERALFARRLRWEREQRAREDAEERARIEAAKLEAARLEAARLEAARLGASRQPGLTAPMLIVPGLANPAQAAPTPTQPAP